jgi:antitoxin (DNA-binding transcriptional repressor) of toxin-antitoxin stability system
MNSLELPRELATEGILQSLCFERLDHLVHVIHIRITMKSTASVRDLRNHFPKVRKILEEEGEVLLTESGTAKYRLVPYSAPPKKTPPVIDYWTRLNSYQPTQISAAASRALDDENRGDR